MAQTFFQNYLHIVFSTKNRFGFIETEIEDDLYGYIGGVVRNNQSQLLKAGGTSNHVHLLVSVGKNCMVPDLVGDIKRSSSKWIKTKRGMLAKFAWQDGYSAFSVGHTQISAVTNYISNQRIHHKQTLFEDEMRGFYAKYEIEFDENLIWG